MLSEDLSQYGFDSITFTELANRLKERYQISITPALFFEYATIESLAQYLWQSHQPALLSYYGSSSSFEIKTYYKKQPANVIRFSKPINDAVKSNTPIEVAIIGMAGKFPGGENLETFWENLAKQRDLITEIPSERFDWRKQAIPKWAGLIKDIDKFDPAFFNISPREAELMDPQQRIFLEAVWQAVEDSGHTLEDFSLHKTGLLLA